MLDEEDNLLGYRGAAINITEIKEAEKALRSASELHQKILNSSPIGISIYNSAGNCIAANDAISKMIGASTSQVLQQNFHTISSWDKSGLYSVARTALKENVKKHHEIAVKTTFGKIGNFDCHLVPISLENRPHLLFMLDDITDRKQAEEKKEKLESQLHQVQKM